jgi:riboflavin kinase/FMN adenylyltransferase
LNYYGFGVSSLRVPELSPNVVVGVVVEGDHRGRELGYPTANINASVDCSPDDGVFAGCVQRADGRWWRAAISVGRRETFYEDGAPLLIEAYLLDFDGDLYGETLWVELHVHLRGQERFSSVDDLVAQIRHDVALTRALVVLPEGGHTSERRPGASVLAVAGSDVFAR